MVLVRIFVLKAIQIQLDKFSQYIVVVTNKPPMCRILRYHFIA